MSKKPIPEKDRKSEHASKLMRVVDHFLKTLPKLHYQAVKGSLTESVQKKPDGRPGKKDRPEN